VYPTRTSSVTSSNAEEEDISTIEPPPPAPLYSLRNCGVTKIACVISLDEEEPATYYDAVNHPHHGKERGDATQEEYNSLMKNETYEVVPSQTH